MTPPSPETPSGRPLGGTPRPALVRVRGARLPGRTEVTPGVHGRPQAAFVVPCKNPTQLQGSARPRASCSGHFRPPKPEFDPIQRPPPPPPLNSRIEKWAAGETCLRIKSFLFLYPGVRPWARGAAGGGGAGAGRGRGDLPARPGGGGGGRLLLGCQGAGCGRGGQGSEVGEGPARAPAPRRPPPAPVMWSGRHSPAL